MMKKFLWTLLFAAFLMPMAANAQCTDGTPCQFTIVGEDTYGDGWEGSLTIYRNNVQMSTFTVDEDDNTQVFTVCAGDLVRIDWSGSDQYGENFFTITSNGIVMVSNAAGETYAPSGTVVEFVACPSCSPVTALAVTNLTSYSCTLTWTDALNSGATYTIYDMSDTSVVATGVTTTSYAINTLDPSTSYTFAVVANCSATDESTPATISFFTPCIPISLPLYEGFDTSSTTLGCWSFVSNNTANVGGSYGAGLVMFTDGTIAWQFSSYSSATDYNQYLYSPIFDVTPGASAINVNVRYATYGSSDHLQFGYITATDTVWDPTIYTTTGNSDWQNFSAIIPATTVRLAVHYYGNYAYYAWIDTVSVTEITGSVCYTISNLTVDSVTSSSVSLSWVDANNSGATYTIYDMSDTSVVASGISDTVYTIENLNANQPYVFGVVANCTATSESDIITINARTACGITSIPYTEGFEGMTTNATPACWSKPNSGNAWAYSSYANTGSNSLRFSGVSGNNVVVLPEFDQEINGLQVRFWTRPESYSNTSCGTFSVGYMTNPADDSSFVVMATYTHSDWTSSTYEEKTVAMTGAPMGSRIAFRHDATSSVWYWFVDDVTVETAGVTPPPANDSVTLVIAVNDPVKGTTTPAPGIYMHATTDPDVTITAIPYTGYTFTGWHINVISSGSMFDTVFNAPDSLNYMMVGFNGGVPGSVVTVTALFGNGSVVDSGYYLTVNYDSTMGDVFYIEGPYQAGDSAFVYAFPNAGYRFVNFTEGGTVVSTDFYYEFVMTGNRTLTANFEIDSMSSADSLTIITAVNNAAMGTVNPAPGIHRYAAGDVYTITATPNSGYFFGGWIVSMDLGFMVYSDTLVGMPPVYSDTVDEFYLGYTMTFTAMFTTDSVPIINPDSITVTFGVNDPAMGTIQPAPGTYVYGVNETVHIEATPNTGYQFMGWQVSYNYWGETFDTILYTDENVIEEPFDEDMGGIVMTIIALFAPEGSQMYTVTVVANNSTLGTVTGGGAYTAGSTVTLTATPATGCSFQAWVINGDTITTNPYSFTITGNVTAMAIFVAGSNGIDDANMANVNVYSADSRIIVKGAEGQDINVYDLNGRMVSSKSNAAGVAEFRMAHTGVYLIKVGNAPAKRVLVVR